ncbi:unnamed protein product [Periconia digitata]|uniref:Uncharacterized protein n=1 Tax=Periconia digitata TaxID=1303443 RepID=A0A9W4UGS2_9PLEO|nr:unnamed protein product [Periconia digitata]
MVMYQTNMPDYMYMHRHLTASSGISITPSRQTSAISQFQRFGRLHCGNCWKEYILISKLHDGILILR